MNEDRGENHAAVSYLDLQKKRTYCQQNYSDVSSIILGGTIISVVISGCCVFL